MHLVEGVEYAAVDLAAKQVLVAGSAPVPTIRTAEVPSFVDAESTPVAEDGAVAEEACSVPLPAVAATPGLLCRKSGATPPRFFPRRRTAVPSAAGAPERRTGRCSARASSASAASCGGTFVTPTKA